MYCRGSGESPRAAPGAAAAAAAAEGECGEAGLEEARLGTKPDGARPAPGAKPPASLHNKERRVARLAVIRPINGHLARPAAVAISCCSRSSPDRVVGPRELIARPAREIRETAEETRDKENELAQINRHRRMENAFANRRRKKCGTT